MNLLDNQVIKKYYILIKEKGRNKVMNEEENCNKVSKKVMISQPMRGKTKEQIYSERESLIAKIEANGDTVVNTIFSDFTDKGNYPLKCLGRSFEVMADVDKVHIHGRMAKCSWMQI